MSKIAVITDRNGVSSTLFEGDLVSIFQKSSDQWKYDNEIPLSLSPKAGMHALRQSMAELIGSLEGCSVIVGREVSGIPYNILDTAGFSIFEIEGAPEEFLDAIYEMSQLSQAVENPPEETPKVPMAPEETEIEGNYWINLTEAQKCDPSMSSKKVLIPFLRNVTFYQLEVICSHIPPWFDVELPNHGFASTVEKLSANEYRVTIYHKTCNEV